MESPDSTAFRRTCPTCNRPVEPGDKFCETCGTQIEELPTCKKCGAQFVEPVNFCDSCGAPVNPGVEPETDDSPADSRDERNRPGEVPVSGRGGDEIPEHRTEISREDREKSSRTPHCYKKEIQEPDTNELLEQFGKEYDAKETLEFSRRPKPETVDDALFLSPGKIRVPAKLPAATTRIIGGIFVVIVVLLAIYFIGLPILAGIGGPGTNGDQTPAAVTSVPNSTGTIPLTTVTTSTLPRALVPQTTQSIPSGQKLYFQVQKNPVTGRISVIFAGSAGEGSIRSADVKVTHPDGSVATGIILPLKGVTEITLAGSNKTDRVEIIAQMSSGGTYRVYDQLLPV